MIGEPVTKEDLQKVLNKPLQQDATRDLIEAELLGLNQGECLRYKAKPGWGMFQDWMLKSMAIDLRLNLKVHTDGDFTYVYNED